jgi:mono/diheme cytochrome c family protein
MLKKSLLLTLWLLIATAVLAACGTSGPPIPPTPTLSAEAQAGKVVFTRECGACHSLIEDTVIVGPSMAGIANRAETRVPGQDSQTYLMTALLQPGDHLVEGYQDLMPANFGKRLTGEEIDALVAFLLTLE